MSRKLVFANQPKADEAISLSLTAFHTTEDWDEQFGSLSRKPLEIASLAFGKLAKTRLWRVRIE